MAKTKYADVEPHDVGDAYLLIGYPAHEMATVAFAYHGPTHQDPRRWMWWLCADDGDQFEFAGQPDLDDMPADDVILIRRVRDGLRERIPEEWRETAIRYEPFLLQPAPEPPPVVTPQDPRIATEDRPPETE